ncbi:hypothetical protein FS842_003720 [Serendipita sp. 407]|nr:hypothetical protein FS842_003720 [Serendipita sp. 407]
MSTNSRLLQLPPEIILVVVCQLPVPDALRCKQACKYLYNLLENSVTVQYLTELYAAYQRPLDTITVTSTADRLEPLRELSSNWANLQFNRFARLEYPFESCAAYELTGGKLIFGSSGTRMIGDLNGTTALIVYDLSYGDAPESEWSLKPQRVTLPYPIADFAMDVSQNLLILAVRTPAPTMSLHIVALDSGVQHPDASKPTLTMPIYAWVTMHISGPILACLYIDPMIGTDIVVIWNWQTGENVGQVAARRMKSIVLLSPFAMVVANLDQESLDIYEINVSDKEVILLRRLLLPRVSTDDDLGPFMYEEALLRAYPSPRYPASSQNPYGKDVHPTDYPFTTEESDGIVACVFHTSGPSHYSLFAHRSALLHPYGDPDSNHRSVAPLIPWSEWGPDNVRWLDIECSMYWICYVHGHRVAVLEKRQDTSSGNVSKDEDPLLYRQIQLRQEIGQRMIEDNSVGAILSELSEEEQSLFAMDLDSRFFSLRVLDFNPRAIRRLKTDANISSISPTTPIRERAGRGQLLVTEPSKMNDIVETRLPYLETTVRLHDLEFIDPWRRVHGVMINGECLILLLSAHESESSGVYVCHL